MSARRSARLSTTTPSSDSTRTDDAVTKAPKTKAVKKEKKLLPIKAASGASDEKMPPPASGRGGKRRASKPGPADDSIDAKGGKEKRIKATEELNVEPTTSAVNATAEAVAPPKTPRKARRADPKATNAPLQTPGGTRVLKKYPTELFETSQDAAGVVTTDNLLETACRHLCSVDPRLKSAIDEHNCHILSPKGLEEEVDPFVALCSSIISQQARSSIRLRIESNTDQVSGAAAASIKNKFIGLFPAPAVPNPKHFPSPAEVSASEVSFLRTAGLSQRKAEYIQGLAEKFASGELSARKLVEASDEELLEMLIAVRGLGRWSVEMFAFFALKRMDIFSTGDLGVQRGVAKYMGRDVDKLKNKGGKDKWKYATEVEMLAAAEPFAPYRFGLASCV